MKKYLVLVSLGLIFVVGCRNLDDLARTGMKNFDPPPVPKTIPIAGSEASVLISNFIKQAGDSAGKSYINQQVVNSLLVSKQSLSDVIFETALEELQKTGEVIVERQIREMRIEAIQVAMVTIADYQEETGSQVEVVE